MKRDGWIAILLTVATVFITTNLFAGQPSPEPMLRLNTEMHFAVVRRVSSDTAERFVLTCGEDKTAKLWNADDGTLLKTFRVPAEQGDEGKLYSCAISPDGKIAAVGGWTKAGFRGVGNHNIYLFNTTTGSIIQRLSGLGSVINDLEFHMDGTLAAVLGGGEGIRVFKQTGGNYTLYKQDSDYGDDSYNLAFDRDGRLATVCSDGYIRLYDHRFNLIKKQKTTGGKDPYSITFSTEGEKLAVGYSDSGTVEVLHGHTLELLYRPDNTGAEERNNRLNKITFNSKGYLYGGGFYQKFVDGRWWHFIRRWSDEGKGAYVDFKAMGSTIMDLKPLRASSILVAGAQSDFGRFDTKGESVFYKRGEIMDFTNYQFNYFTVNRDGSKISFQPKRLKSFTFSIPDRELKHFAELFEKYRDRWQAINVTDWKDSYSPKINKKEAGFLKRNERNRSVDIADDRTLLFGTEWNVYATDRSGKRKWKTPVPGTTWAVNISTNGKIAVAAHGGGQIRWYRMRDGEVLLSLFVHPDGKRWILWSPKGYFDASPGADSLVGWHVNNGSDRAASFYPVSQFATKYYRPDVVANIIRYNDFDKALLYADKNRNKKPNNLTIRQLLPPEITILSPKNGTAITTNRVTIRYRIRNPSGEAVTGIHLFVDGRPAKKGDVQFQKELQQVTVRVPSKESTVSLIAENRNSTSTHTTIRLRWKGENPLVFKPNLYLLAIGVSDYQEEKLKLNYAAKDATDFARVLKRQKGVLYRDIKAKVLTDESATQDEILDGLDWILKETTQKDVAMIFLAGHGVNDDYGRYYYLPRDTIRKKLRRTAVSYNEIKDVVSNIPGKALFFIDTCHSGNVLGTRGGEMDINKIANELSNAQNGVIVFASSTGKQNSVENHSWKNGAFTEALVEGFSGKAVFNGNGKITVNSLDYYVSERVKELTDGKQTPATAKPEATSDFPIAVIQ